MSGAKPLIRQPVEVELESTHVPMVSKADLEARLRTLREEKREAENRLKGINDQISNVTSKLEDTLSPDLAKFLSMLSNSEALAKAYVDKMLRNYVELREEISENSQNINRLYLEVETWIEALYDAMRTKKMIFLSSLVYDLELIEKDYKHSGKVNYEYLFKIIREDFKKQADNNADLPDFLECIDFLRNQVLQFY
jgi:chromosome segregation ATPase